MLALLEPIVAMDPKFAHGQFWLGGAPENIGREVMRTNPKLVITEGSQETGTDI